MTPEGRISQDIERFRHGAFRSMVSPTHHVRAVAIQLKNRMTPHCTRIEVAGSIRRKVPNPVDIDIVCIPIVWAELKSILSSWGPTIRSGQYLHSFTYSSIQVDVYPSTIKTWGAMLLFLTGPSQYNIGLRKIAKEKGFLLNQYGLWKGVILIASKSEEAIYHSLGRTFTRPELRGI